jgi:hypothetical protein
MNLLDFCNETLNTTEDDWFKNDTRPFQKYFPKNSLALFNGSKFKNFDISAKIINIEELVFSTCYKVNIYPCTKKNYLQCDEPTTITTSTQKKPVPKKKGSINEELQNSVFHSTESSESTLNLTILTTVLIVLTVVPIMFFYTYKTYSRKKAQEPKSELELQPIDNYEIERENIVTMKLIGRGEFGVVFLGFVKPDESKLYAIKTLAEGKEHYEESFVKEAQFMRSFDAHHVVKLIGYCTRGMPLLVVMELMKHGDLKKFLRKNQPVSRTEPVMQASSSYTSAPISVKSLYPIRSVAEMAIEIADGMMYLESLKFIHCDLACRNCMVHESFTIKIGDFGMARELYHSDYYKPGSRNKKIPLRWMSPEALGSDTILPRYTSKSDVFSFGVVLFELVTYCEKPYSV